MKTTAVTAFALAFSPQLAALVPSGDDWRALLHSLLWALASAGFAWLLQFLRGPPTKPPDFPDSGGS